ncbi:MAG: hypothetical protein V3T31_08010 [candidate division Zixibacteria bacterium]
MYNRVSRRFVFTDGEPDLLVVSPSEANELRGQPGVTCLSKCFVLSQAEQGKLLSRAVDTLFFDQPEELTEEEKLHDITDPMHTLFPGGCPERLRSEPMPDVPSRPEKIRYITITTTEYHRLCVLAGLC